MAMSKKQRKRKCAIGRSPAQKTTHEQHDDNNREKLRVAEVAMEVVREERREGKPAMKAQLCPEL